MSKALGYYLGQRLLRKPMEPDSVERHYEVAGETEGGDLLLRPVYSAIGPLGSVTYGQAQQFSKEDVDNRFTDMVQ